MASKIDKSDPNWLANWVQQDIDDRKRATAERARNYVREPKSEGLPRYVPLKVWAEIMFGEHVPSMNTIYKWIGEGRIYPPPKKIGSRIFVSPDADYME